MATLQKFKFLASQCAVAGSPTRSPTTSPVIHLRRRKTLKMLLGRGGGGWGKRLPPRSDDGSPDRRVIRGVGDRSLDKRSELSSVSQKLRDLFVSSPPTVSENVREGLLPLAGGGRSRGGGNSSMRPLTATIRQRLLRRAWRPVLVAIPEEHL